MLQRGFLMGRWYENKSPFICTRYQLSAHKSRKKVQINKKVKDYKSLLLKRSTFFEEKDQMRSNSEETCRLLGKNAKKITIDFLLSLSSVQVFKLCTIIVLCTTTHIYLSHYLTLFSPLWCTTPWNAISDLIERWKICVLCKMHRPCL